MIMLEQETKVATLIEPTTDKLRDYLDTYLSQHNEMSQTYLWLKSKLTSDQIREWERTIDALLTVTRALDAGFDPITPPKNWASGLLIQYIAPIPQHVREAIDKAEDIFGRHRILIYDPNEEHFQRPRKTDPMAVGFVDLARQRLHFLLGAWDIKADLKWIDGIPRQLDEASRRVGEVISPFIMPQGSSSPNVNIITVGDTTTSGQYTPAYWGNQATWSSTLMPRGEWKT